MPSTATLDEASIGSSRAKMGENRFSLIIGLSRRGRWLDLLGHPMHSAMGEVG
jgi:hypothetical protein